jgi:hypothetical protein
MSYTTPNAAANGLFAVRSGVVGVRERTVRFTITCGGGGSAFDSFGVVERWQEWSLR